MAALPPTRSRPRWLALGVLAVLGAGLLVWQLGGDGGAGGANGKRSGRGAGVSGDPDGSRGGPLAWRMRAKRNRGLGPIAAHPPADGLVRVTGQVVDASSGKPVSDVEVVFADGQSEATTQSDLAGRYSIDVRPGHYRPFVRADGIISVGRAPRERLPGRPRTDQIAASRLEVAPDLAVYSNLAGADLEVVRAGRIAGRVFDRDGRPIAGALVRATPSDGEELRPVLGTDVAETDLDGTFKLELGEAQYVVEAFHDRYGATEAAPTIAVSAGDTVTADLTMIAGCVISGHVVRENGGDVGDGAIERGYSADPGSGYYPSGSFSEDGEFRWTTTEEGEVTLRAWPWKATHSPSRTFSCADGARYQDVVFMIPSIGADLGGTIVTARGAPAARAFIDVQGMSEGTMNQQERADDEGQWEVFALPPGQYLVTAYVEGEGATSAILTSPGNGNRLQLSGTGSLIGRVTGVGDGTFTLMLSSCETEHGMVYPRSRHLVTVQGGGYRLDGLPACTLRVEAENRARRRGFEVTIEAGGVATVDLDLEPPKAKRVSGVVRDQDGRTVEGVAVTAINQDVGGGVSTSTTTDDGGRFVIEVHGGDLVIFGHPGGTAELMISDDDPDHHDVDITLTPGDW